MIIGPRPELPVSGTNTATTPAAAGPATYVSGTQRADQLQTIQAEQALKQLVQSLDLLSMAVRIERSTDFDSRNKVFHEYFDRQPDDESKKPFFFTFVSMLPEAERATLDHFFKTLEQQKQGQAA